MNVCSCLTLLMPTEEQRRARRLPLLTDSQVEAVIDELLQAVGNIRLSAAGCSRRQPAASRNRTRAARPAARLLPDCPTCCPT